MPPSPLIELRLLGAPAVTTRAGADVPAVLSQPKRFALLAYLAAATPRGFHRRDSLLALFWPEADQAHARSALRGATYFLRRELGPGVIVNRGDEDIGLAQDALWCDVEEFEKALAGGHLAEALALYRGDFLPGFFIAGARACEQWLEEERNRLRAKAAEAAWALAERLERQRDGDGAAQWARWALSLSPDDERALRRLIALLGRLGDRAGAIRAYQEFAERLERDYEVAPLPETQQLMNAVRAGEAPPTPADAVPSVTGSSLFRARAGLSGSVSAGAGTAGTSTDEQRQIARLARTLSDRYAIERKLAGGMIMTYAARATRENRALELHVVQPRLAALASAETFLAVLGRVAALSDPHIVPTYDVGAIEDVFYYVTAPREGGSLREYLARERQLPVEEALAIGRGVAAALAHAHERGVWHGDLRPKHIIVTPRRTIVASFALVEALSGRAAGPESTSATVMAIGAPAYVSPEQVMGETRPDARSDVYSLGCVLYESLVGEPPFGRSGHAGALGRKLTQPPPSIRAVRESVPEALEQVVLKCLARVPADRFRTAAELGDALGSLCKTV